MIQIIKGDSIQLECQSDVDLTTYEIRCEIWDKGSVSIKKGSATVSGGSDSQIDVDDSDNTKFYIYIDADETTSIDSRASIEIEIKNAAGTVAATYKDDIYAESEQITWTDIT